MEGDGRIDSEHFACHHALNLRQKAPPRRGPRSCRSTCDLTPATQPYLQTPCLSSNWQATSALPIIVERSHTAHRTLAAGDWAALDVITNFS